MTIRSVWVLFLSALLAGNAVPGPIGAQAPGNGGALPDAPGFVAPSLLTVGGWRAASPEAGEADEPGPRTRQRADRLTADRQPAQVRQTDDPRILRPRLMALGGASGLGSGGGMHAFAGLEGGFLYGRFGALALTQYGTGNDFTSLLLAGGPAAELYDAGFASLTLYAGGAWYREELDVGFERDMAALYGGLAVRVPLPRGAVGMTVSVWQGSLDEPGFAEAATLRAHRFSFGLGL